MPKKTLFLYVFPVFREIIKTRPYGHHRHERHKHVGNDVVVENSDIKRIECSLCYRKSGERHLCNSLELSEVSSSYNGAVGACGNETYGRDSELAEDNYSGSYNEASAVYFIVSCNSVYGGHIAKAEQGRHYHEFIRKGVEEFAEIRNETVFTSDTAVEEVRKACRDIDNGGYNVSPETETEIAKIEYHKQGYEENSQKTELVRKIHNKFLSYLTMSPMRS